MAVTIESNSFDSFAAGSWISDSKGWWYVWSDGTYPVTGWYEIEGEWYYFTSDGYMDYSEYRDGYWLNSDGTINYTYSGGRWMSDSVGWWYIDSSGWYPQNQWVWIDGYCYYFKSDGYMATDEWIGEDYVDSSGHQIKDKTGSSTSNPEKVMTQQQAYDAVVKYCKTTNPYIEDAINNGSMLYWAVGDTEGDTEGDTYTIIYRSYTASFVYYHVNRISGNVTTTEFVPGITDGEVPSDITFNAWDYI